MVEETEKIKREEKPEKNQAAVALGRFGGMKGGKARAATLSAEKRKEIVLKAAATRWRKEAKAKA